MSITGPDDANTTISNRFATSGEIIVKAGLEAILTSLL